MIQELNLTFEQSLILILVLLPVAIWGFKHLGTVTIDEPEPKVEQPVLNPNYGRYVQLRGVYHD